jgi:hypothetical protein
LQFEEKERLTKILHQGLLQRPFSFVC